MVVLLSFLRAFYTLFHYCCTSLHPHSQRRRVPFSPHLSAFICNDIYLWLSLDGFFLSFWSHLALSTKGCTCCRDHYPWWLALGGAWQRRRWALTSTESVGGTEHAPWAPCGVRLKPPCTWLQKQHKCLGSFLLLLSPDLLLIYGGHFLYKSHTVLSQDLLVGKLKGIFPSKEDTTGKWQMICRWFYQWKRHDKWRVEEPLVQAPTLSAPPASILLTKPVFVCSGILELCVKSRHGQPDVS